MRFERLQPKDFFTLANAGFGFLALYYARTEYLVASVLVALAALTDFLDGKIARSWGKSNAFGRELDSLADAVSFGVAPAMVSVLFAAPSFLAIHVATAVVFSWAAIIRLARFNLYASEAKFYGLPAPLAAVSLVALAPFFGSFTPLLLLALAALMLASFEMKKPK